MRVRSLLSATALLASLGLSSALSSKAMAAGTQFLNPNASWAVSQMGQGSAAYCALARRFQQNTILTLARNASDETSFALDFQRPVFKVGQQVDVVLDPGAGQQRSYKATPASNQAFVTRMGRDSSFFKALEKTGFLRVEINGQSYHFNISDLSDGQSKLESCMVSMVMPAAGDETDMAMEGGVLTPGPESVGAAPAADLSSYRQEINTLRRQIANLTKQNESLSGQAGVPVSGDLTVLSSRIETLTAEKKVLEQQLAAANEPKLTTIRPNEDVVELESLRKENLRLKAELQTDQPSADVLADYQLQIEGLKSENKRLLASVAEVKDAGGGLQSAALEGRVRELEAENAALNAQVSQILAQGEVADTAPSPELAALQAENAELKANLSKKGVDSELLEQLRQQIAQVQNENRLLEETAGKIESDLKAAHLAEMETLRQENALSLDKVKAEMAGLAQDDTVLAALQAEAEDLKSQNTSLQAKIEADKAALTEVAALREAKAALEAQKAELESKLARAESADTSAAEKLAALEAENSALKAKVESVQVLVVNSEENLAALEAENSGLQAQITEAQSEQLSVSRSLEAELAALEAEKSALNAQIESASAAEASLSELTVKNQSLKEALGEVVALAESYKSKAIDAAADSEALATLMADKAVSEGKLAVLEQKNAELEKRLIENSRVAVAEEDAVAKEEALQKKIAMLEDQLEMVKAQKDDEIEQMQRKFASLEGKAAHAVPAVVEQKAAVAAAPKPAPTPTPTPTPVTKPLEASKVALASAPESAALLRPEEVVVAKEIVPHARVPNPRVQEIVRPDAFARVPLARAEAAQQEDMSGLNQAQILERQMKGRIENGGLMASKKQDPFEDMSVTPEQAYADVVAEGLRPVEALKAPLERAQEAVSIPQADFQPVSSPVMDGLYRPGFDIAQMLNASRSVEKGSFEVIQGATDSQRVAYQWVTPARVFGSAEQQPLASAGQFDNFVEAYIERTQERCPGEFAVSLDRTSGEGEARADSYEVACVGGDISSSASLLFFAKGETFTAVAYEAPTNKLMEAMESRNQIMQMVQGQGGGWTLASR